MTDDLTSADVETRKALEREISTQIAFQRRWRIISMTGYSVTTVGSLIGSASATICSGMGLNVPAAILAAIATILLGAEKSLLFREKWQFHLLMHTKLQALRSQLLLSRTSLADASDQYYSIMTSYAMELSMAERDGRASP